MSATSCQHRPVRHAERSEAQSKHLVVSCANLFGAHNAEIPRLPYGALGMTVNLLAAASRQHSVIS